MRYEFAMQNIEKHPKHELLGHPRGLFVLFFTEMWERFSYYGMRALLVLYMTKVLLVETHDQSQIMGMLGLKSILEGVFGPLSVIGFSSQIYGLYTGLVYFTPFFGGLIADKYLGARKSVYVGGILMAIGHFLMASESTFLLALLFLILGNGFFKPNISVQVGNFYTLQDSRRDRAFMIFYMGINLGAFLSPLVCGTLGEKVGWHYGFTAAGVGMILGLIVYYFGRWELPAEPLKEQRANHTVAPLTSEDYKKVWALVLLCIVNILFWGVYEQQGNILQIWSDKNVDWMIAGFQVPSSWMQSINPLLIFTFGPLINKLWSWQSRRGSEPNSVLKMAIGCFMCGFAYIVMFWTAHTMQAGTLISPIWIWLTIFLFTLGELYLSPIGLSLVTKLAPPKIVSMMMGLWLMSSFFGNYLSGFLGMFYETLGDANFFLMLVAMSAVAGIIFVVAYRPLRKVIPDTNEKSTAH